MNLVNLEAESGADIVGDDSQPTFRLDNSSVGGIQAHSLRVEKRAGGNASIAPIEIVAAANASAPAMEFERSGFVSITSVVLTTVANTDYAIRVMINGAARWIPCFKDAAIVGGAAFTDNSAQTT